MYCKNFHLTQSIVHSYGAISTLPPDMYFTVHFVHRKHE